MRYLLVFVIGALLGANVAWYYARPAATPCPQAPAAAAMPTPAPAASTAAPAVAAPTAPVTSAATTPPAAAVPTALPPPTIAASGLVIPVAGVRPAQLVDTYTQSRGEGRVHEAIDIMAPAGTPVVAAVDGPVAKLFTSVRGGITVYQFDTTGTRVYYYAHLQGYAPGLAQGQVLKQGQLLGYVGSTGDASPEGPHLHFSVGDLGPEKQWSKSTPVNPYPLLAR
ncbi:M23 family metallopeptidase [Lysobacter xanthus]